MKPLLGLLAVVLLALGVTACGSSMSHGSTATTASTTKRDRDNDNDNNDDDAHVLYYGRAPSAPERQAIVSLVTSYYAASAAEDGAKGCTLLMPFVAESVAENYGHNPGLRGKTCAVVLSKLFAQNHSLLSGKNATLKFYTVRVDGTRALTVLSFSTLPEVRQLTERRDAAGAWKVLNLFDGILE
jgi:hypothetical protein